MEFEYLELIFFEFQVVDLLIWHLKPKATEEKSIVVHISVNRIFLTSNISLKNKKWFYFLKVDSQKVTRSVVTDWLKEKQLLNTNYEQVRRLLSVSRFIVNNCWYNHRLEIKINPYKQRRARQGPEKTRMVMVPVMASSCWSSRQSEQSWRPLWRTAWRGWTSARTKLRTTRNWLSMDWMPK